MIDWQTSGSNPSRPGLDDAFEPLYKLEETMKKPSSPITQTPCGWVLTFMMGCEHYDRAILFIMNFHMIIAGAFMPSDQRAKQMASEGLDRAIKAVTDRGLIKLIP